MKLKDLYEQYELKKNDDVKNNHKEDIYETENYMFYDPYKQKYIIKLNPTDNNSTDYFNKHILNYKFVGDNVNDKIKNLFTDHLDYFRHINNMNHFYFLYNIGDILTGRFHIGIILTTTCWLNLAILSLFVIKKIVNFHMINDIFIEV